MSDKRALIIDAAIELFAADGFWNTSTASISKKAGVATGTLFNQFDSKDALIDALYAELKQESLAAVTAAAAEVEGLRDILAASWRAYIGWALANPARYRLLDQLRVSELVSAEARSRVAETYAEFTALMDGARKTGAIIDLPLDYHFDLLIGQINAAIAYLVSPDAAGEDRDALIEAGFAAYWRGVRNQN